MRDKLKPVLGRNGDQPRHCSVPGVSLPRCNDPLRATRPESTTCVPTHETAPLRRPPLSPRSPPSPSQSLVCSRCDGLIPRHTSHLCSKGGRHPHPLHVFSASHPTPTMLSNILLLIFQPVDSRCMIRSVTTLRPNETSCW